MDLIRTVKLHPYLKGQGPTFTLRMWDTEMTNQGKPRLRYELRQHEHGKTTVLFSEEDFCCSPCYAINSDKAVAALIGFLTLKRGDTDDDYFNDYTPAQTTFSEQHAEALQFECFARFGDD